MDAGDGGSRIRDVLGTRERRTGSPADEPGADPPVRRGHSSGDDAEPERACRRTRGPARRSPRGRSPRELGADAHGERVADAPRLRPRARRARLGQREPARREPHPRRADHQRARVGGDGAGERERRLEQALRDGHATADRHRGGAGVPHRHRAAPGARELAARARAGHGARAVREGALRRRHRQPARLRAGRASARVERDARGVADGGARARPGSPRRAARDERPDRRLGRDAPGRAVAAAGARRGGDEATRRRRAEAARGAHAQGRPRRLHGLSPDLERDGAALLPEPRHADLAADRLAGAAPFVRAALRRRAAFGVRGRAVGAARGVEDAARGHAPSGARRRPRVVRGAPAGRRGSLARPRSREARRRITGAHADRLPGRRDDEHRGHRRRTKRARRHDGRRDRRRRREAGPAGGQFP